MPKINPLDKIMKVMKNQNSDKSFTLFQTNDDKDIDLKTDVLYPEDVHISTLKFNDAFLASKGLNPIYSSYLKDFLRIRVSLERGSRKEFVEVNKKDHTSDQLAKLGSIKNLAEVRN